MTHRFGVPCQGLRREDGLEDHTHVPLATAADLDVGWVAPGPVETGVGQDDQLAVVAGEQGLEGLVMDIGGVAIPIGHQPQLVEYHAERSVPPTIQR